VRPQKRSARQREPSVVSETERETPTKPQRDFSPKPNRTISDSQYWTLDKLHETAKGLFYGRVEESDTLTQQDVVDIINRDREARGEDTVTRQAVTNAISEGSSRYRRLLCDMIDALMTVGGRIEREGGEPVLYVRWHVPEADHPESETKTIEVG